MFEERRMALTNEQISSLLGMISASKEDLSDCDGCFDHLAEFADTELAGREIPDALKAVESHLQQCSCCKDEYQTLLKGLREIRADR